MNWRLKKFAAAISCVLGVAASAAQVSADRKVFAGTNCMKEGTSVPKYAGPRAAAYTAMMICPVVRDNTYSSMDVTDWDVSVEGAGGSGTWHIALYSRNHAGTKGYIYTVRTSDHTGVQHIDGAPIPYAFSDGLMYILSWMPSPGPILYYPGPAIIRYAVSES